MHGEPPPWAPSSSFSHKIYYRNVMIRRGFVLPRFRFALQASSGDDRIVVAGSFLSNLLDHFDRSMKADFDSIEMSSL